MKSAKPNNNENEKIEQHILENYTIIKKLGCGAYGHVWKVKHKTTNQIYALKKIFSAFFNELDAERTYREISLLNKLNHSNIIKLIKVIKAKNNLDLYLIFDHMQSDLFKAIKGQYLSIIHKKYIVYQLAKSIKYLHSGGIIHRDIKPSNILIDQDCKIKLCDFGLSRTTFKYSKQVGNQNNQKMNITQFIATRWYRAPQVMLGSKHYDIQSDIWSFGCFIYQLFTAKVLLPGQDNIDQVVKLLEFKGKPSKQEQFSLKISEISLILQNYDIDRIPEEYYYSRIEDEKLIKLLKEIFIYDPMKRPTAQQILQSDFLKQFQSYDQDDQIVCNEQISLQQDQFIKLNVTQYRNMVYQYFAQQQPILIEKTLNNILQSNKQNQQGKILMREEKKRIMREEKKRKALNEQNINQAVRRDEKKQNIFEVKKHESFAATIKSQKQQKLLQKDKKQNSFYQQQIQSKSIKKQKQTSSQQNKILERKFKYKSEHTGYKHSSFYSKKNPTIQTYVTRSIQIDLQKEKEKTSQMHNHYQQTKQRKKQSISFFQKKSIHKSLNSSQKNLLFTYDIIKNKLSQKNPKANLSTNDQSEQKQTKFIHKNLEKQKIINVRSSIFKSTHKKHDSLNVSFNYQKFQPLTIKNSLTVNNSLNNSMIVDTSQLTKIKKSVKPSLQNFKQKKLKNIKQLKKENLSNKNTSSNLQPHETPNKLPYINDSIGKVLKELVRPQKIVKKSKIKLNNIVSP